MSQESARSPFRVAGPSSSLLSQRESCVILCTSSTRLPLTPAAPDCQTALEPRCTVSRCPKMGDRSIIDIVVCFVSRRVRKGRRDTVTRSQTRRSVGVGELSRF